MPAVSVILATRNRDRFLPDSLKSLLNQRFDDFEVIVADDASSDNTIKVVASFKDKRIKYMRSSSCVGASSLRKRALKFSKGEFIIYTDDDAIMYPDYLRVPFEFLKANKLVDIAYTDCHFYFPDKEVFLPYSVDFDKNRLEIEDYIPGFCYMHRRRCLREIEGWEDNEILNKNGLQDWDFLLQLSDKFEFKHIKGIGGKHIYHGGNISLRKKRYLSYVHIIKKRMNKFRLEKETIPFRGYLTAALETFYHRFMGTATEGGNFIKEALFCFPLEAEASLAACLHSIKKENYRKAELFLNEATKLNNHIVKNRKGVFDIKLLTLNIEILRVFLEYGGQRKLFQRNCNRMLISTINNMDFLSNILTKAVRRFISNSYLKKDILKKKVYIGNNLNI